MVFISWADCQLVPRALRSDARQRIGVYVANPGAAGGDIWVFGVGLSVFLVADIASRSGPFKIPANIISNDPSWFCL